MVYVCGLRTEVGIQVRELVKEFMQAINKEGLIRQHQTKSHHLHCICKGTPGCRTLKTNTNERKSGSGTVEVTYEGATEHTEKT